VVADKLVAGETFRHSENKYDWLGSGIYFWEANPNRALDYANELKSVSYGPEIDDPAVVGAVIDLGLCLDLTTAAGVQQVKEAFEQYRKLAEGAGWPLPENHKDLRRDLDCAVIQYFHEIRESAGDPEVDTVKGIFVEGDPIYPDSGFYDKTHIQICVCNPDRIMGVFRVHPRFLR
jgi:hypothetical protein